MLHIGEKAGVPLVLDTSVYSYVVRGGKKPLTSHYRLCRLTLTGFFTCVHFPFFQRKAQLAEQSLRALPNLLQAKSAVLV